MRMLAGIVSGAAALAGCASVEPIQQAPAAGFFEALSAHCGKAYAGRAVADDGGDGGWDGERLVMHLADCTDDVIRIPLSVGEDRSRTWVVSRVGDDRLELKHDHRHEDGSPDAVTMYGGTSVTDGTAARQSFPVDAQSVALFEAEGLSASTVNVWAMEIGAETFAYELRRPTGRYFRAEFDLTEPVPAPPPPWGG
ncbi:hypothetical protein [Sphingomicrobium aestuariivivum]|uniref:hypothetical protein n=1 Tax=Sphingomicrobium aestuariivivum TaxID=1582356 RepID=UPI001FD6F2BB|nr:hypothetical protein [Sphingomicrobium aestuariivivum]MCJ8191076.1 hypothetical protein [Sphingomicrobium aestuariivivum]